MPISRRAFSRLFAVAGIFAAPMAAKAAADSGLPKVVYHLSDTEKIGFVLVNIDNHIKGMGGPDKVVIALVVHGPPLAMFVAGKAAPDFAKHVERLGKVGVSLIACGNTMAAQKLVLADLLPGFAEASEGGVVRLAKLQDEGYAYLRP